jgi:hypothetical protein
LPIVRGTSGWSPSELAQITIQDMKKRVLATSLWFFAGWYGGAVIAWALGLSPVLGPILAVAAATLVAIDPRHVIWAAGRRAPTQTKSQEPT